jgi:hypothetical protein
MYVERRYCADARRHGEDAKFKATNFLKVFLRVVNKYGLEPNSFVDVGCGSGNIVKIVVDCLRVKGFESAAFKDTMSRRTL